MGAGKGAGIVLVSFCQISGGATNFDIVLTKINTLFNFCQFLCVFFRNLSFLSRCGWGEGWVGCSGSFLKNFRWGY